uniref:Uncharacterized protein n=1 Tax=Muribaculaceae bacterium Z82 TaxID=2304548 RepID=A0A7C9JE38_9BACT
MHDDLQDRDSSRPRGSLGVGTELLGLFLLFAVLALAGWGLLTVFNRPMLAYSQSYSSDRFSTLSGEPVGNVRIVVDEETGVMYAQSLGFSKELVPLVDADGNLIVADGYGPAPADDPEQPEDGRG